MGEFCFSMPSMMAIGFYVVCLVYRSGLCPNKISFTESKYIFPNWTMSIEKLKNFDRGADFLSNMLSWGGGSEG